MLNLTAFFAGKLVAGVKAACHLRYEQLAKGEVGMFE
jgi:hypothetical protein